MTLLIFFIVITSEILLGSSLIITLFFPNKRVWPPPQKNSWQFWFTWILTIFSFGGVIVLGFLDWGSFYFNPWFQYLLGVPLIIGGLLIVLWGIHTLSVNSTLGLKGKLIINGAYKYTRNPQYVGDILLIIGIIFFMNSFLTLVTGILGLFWFFLAPFTEEPILKKHFGEEYDSYCRKVPRFVKLKFWKLPKTKSTTH